MVECLGALATDLRGTSRGTRPCERSVQPFMERSGAWGNSCIAVAGQEVHDSVDCSARAAITCATRPQSARNPRSLGRLPSRLRCRQVL